MAFNKNSRTVYMLSSMTIVFSCAVGALVCKLDEWCDKKDQDRQTRFQNASLADQVATLKLDAGLASLQCTDKATGRVYAAHAPSEAKELAQAYDKGCVVIGKGARSGAIILAHKAADYTPQ